MASPELGLESIWPEGALERFRNAWIETPFQLVSIAESANGIQAVAELSGLPAEKAADLIEQSRRLLTDDEKAQLSRALDASEMPLGALKPKP